MIGNKKSGSNLRRESSRNLPRTKSISIPTLYINRPFLFFSLYQHNFSVPESPGRWQLQMTLSLIPNTSSKTLQFIYESESHSIVSLCDSMDYTVHGILQARILEQVAFPFSRGSSQPRDWTQVSCIAGELFYQRNHQGSPQFIYRKQRIILHQFGHFLNPHLKMSFPRWC